MDQIKIELLHITPEEVVIEAAKQSYELEEGDLNLVDRIINKYHHESVAEHTTFNFKVSGVSRAELQEHMRHRISSSTVKSTRRTILKMLKSFGKIFETTDFLLSVSPEEWKPLLKKYFVHPKFDNIKEVQDLYDSWLASTIITLHEVTKYTRNQDHLKSFLPESLRTSFVWSINLRSLRNFIKLRIDKSSHYEIRTVAQRLLESIKDTYAYRYFKDLEIPEKLDF